MRGLEGEAAEDAPLLGRPMMVVALFAMLVFAPVSGYFLFFASDWACAYLLDTQRIPSAIALLCVVADGGAVLLGFGLARTRVRERDALGALMLAAVPAGAALLGFLALFARLRVHATYRQFHGDFGAEPLAGGPLGYAVLWMDLLLVAGMVIAARALARPPRSIRPGGPPSDEPAGDAPRLLGSQARSARKRTTD
jgi:hypothetical protein